MAKARAGEEAMKTTMLIVETIVVGAQTWIALTLISPD
jgi:hypothetical protein